MGTDALRLLGSLGYGPGLLDWALRGEYPASRPVSGGPAIPRTEGNSGRAAALGLFDMNVRAAAQSAGTGEALTAESAAPSQLGKDDFLRLLIMQIRYQDPTNPVDDRAFLAQMAQFSALEQTTKVADGLARLGEQLQVAQQRQFALSLLGHRVEVQLPDGGQQQGTVEAIKWSATGPQVVIGGQAYGIEQVSRTLS